MNRLHPSYVIAAVVAATLALSASAVSARMLFVPGQPISVDSRPVFLKVVDLDGDGLDDVLLGSTRGTLSILYGSAESGSLFSGPHVHVFGKKLRRPNAGDITGDGIVDIAVPDESGEGVWVLVGRGDRSFDQPRFLFIRGLKPYSVAIANIDGLGGDDLVIGDRRRGRINLQLNSGSFAFRSGARLPAATNLRQVECSDLDGDQLPELLALSPGRSGSLAVFDATSSSNGQAQYRDSLVFSLHMRDADLEIADFDGNGTNDLAVLERERRGRNSRVEVMTRREDGTYSTEMSVDTDCIGQRYGRTCRARGLAAADFDGDGIIDIAVGLRGQSFAGALNNRRAGALSILKGRGDTFVPVTVIPWLEKPPTELGAGDFNGDGRPDIVAISKSRSLLQGLWNISDLP